MKKNTVLHPNLHYLYNKSKRIFWVKIAGPRLPPIQSYDVVFDEKDLKIRKLI